MATSNVNSGSTSKNASDKKTKTVLPVLANNFVSFIKELITDIVKDIAPRVYTAEVVGVNEENGDRRYDIRIVSDPDSSVIHGIVNNTRFDLKQGDYVEILSTQNDLSVSYIINKFQPPLPANNVPQRDPGEDRTNIDNKLEVRDEGESTYSYLETSDGKFFLLQDAPPDENSGD